MTPQTTISDLAEQAGGAILGDSTPRHGSKPPRLFRLGFQVEGLHSSVREAHREVQWLLSDLATGQNSLARWVYLGGKSGCGKTHLARASVDALLAEGFRPYEVQFWSWRKAKALVSERAGGMQQLHNLDFLALDDVGTGFTASDKAKDFAASVLLELLEGRLGKWTLITSNLAPRDVAARLDPRIASRLVRGGNVLVDLSLAGDFCLDLYKNGQADMRPSIKNARISHRMPPSCPRNASGVQPSTSEEQAAFLRDLRAISENTHFPA